MNKKLQMILLTFIMSFFTATGFAVVFCYFFDIVFQFKYAFYTIGVIFLFDVIMGFAEAKSS